MTDLTLVLPMGEDHCQVLLACGHWSQPMSVASSTFDFPMDPIPCPICRDVRCLDVRLQSMLFEDRDRG